MIAFSLPLRDQVRRARAERRVVAAPADHDPTLADAYAIQAELFGDGAPRGYKLGLVSRAKQSQMGIDSPIFGRISDDMLLDAPVDLARFIQPRMEPEVAVVLHDRLAPGCAPTAVASAVGAAFLGIDFLDSVWDGYRFSPAQVVADNSSGGGFLLGERALPYPFSGGLRMLLDGEPVAEGPLGAIGDVPGHLAWLASEVGGLDAGTVVFLGSPAAAVPARPGLLELHGPSHSRLVARLEDSMR